MSAEENQQGRQLLVAVDDSEGSTYALNFTLSNIIRPDDTITLVHSRPLVDMDMFYGTPSWIEVVDQKYQQESDALLQRMHQIVQKYKIKCETMSVKGDARDKMVEAVKKLSPDLLVMGSRGHGLIKRTFLGSVSDYAVHNAECPVLIVRYPEESKKAPKKNGKTRST